MQATPEKHHDKYSAFRHVSYQRYFMSRFLSAFAIQILSVAVAWQIYDETQSALLLGLIGLVQFLPALLLVVVTGIASDKLGRRMVMGAAILTQMVCAVGIFYLAVAQRFNPVWVLSILTLFGVARAFYSPAAVSLAVNLVPREDFANAVGWNTSAGHLATIVGPAAGGLLYGLSGPFAYGVSVVIFLLSALLIFSIPKPHQVIQQDESNLDMILGGFRYIWKQKIVLGAISLDLFAVLLGGAVALLPIYARDILELGPTGLGFLRAAPGVGAILMVFYLSSFPIKDHAGKILFFSVAMFGAMTAIFGASKLAWLSIIALIGVGAFDMISVYIREIILQLWTPDHVRGRVNAVNSIFLGASNELGEFRAGMMAAVYGAVFTVVGGGAAAIGVSVLWARIFPSLRNTRSLDDDPVEADRSD